MRYVLEIDWSSFVGDALINAADILVANAVITVNSNSGITYVRHINWDSLATIYIKVKQMRIKYTNYLDKIDDVLPDEDERPRLRMTQNEIDYLENMRDEGYRLLEIGDAKLQAFNWKSIIDIPSVPTHDQAVDLLIKITEYQSII
jgi:hypothetical protein